MFDCSYIIVNLMMYSTNHIDMINDNGMTWLIQEANEKIAVIRHTSNTGILAKAE